MVWISVGSPTHHTSGRLYGVFFEDINHGADGGLNANMVNNYSFDGVYLDHHTWRMAGAERWRTQADSLRFWDFINCSAASLGSEIRGIHGQRVTTDCRRRQFTHIADTLASRPMFLPKPALHIWKTSAITEAATTGASPRSPSSPTTPIPSVSRYVRFMGGPSCPSAWSIGTVCRSPVSLDCRISWTQIRLTIRKRPV